MNSHVELDAYLQAFDMSFSPMLPRIRMKKKMKSLLVMYLPTYTYLPTYSIELRESNK